MNDGMLTLLIIACGFFATLLGLYSGASYTNERVDNENEDYAGTIKEARGPVSIFLWACYVTIALWSVIYLVRHSQEFRVLTS